MPETNAQNVPFVKRVEMAIMQYVILNKAQEGEVTRENLKNTFRGNMQMSGDHFDHCITQLVQDGHLREVGGNKYTVTDDGREDVHKLQTIVMELPQVAGATGGKGGTQKNPQQTATAGYSSTSGQTRGTTGNPGNVGPGTQNPGQPKGGPGNSS